MSLYEQRLLRKSPSALVFDIAYRLEPLAREYWESLPYPRQRHIIMAWKAGHRTLRGIVAEMRDLCDPR